MISQLIAFIAMFVAVFADIHGPGMTTDYSKHTDGGSSVIGGSASVQQSMLWITVAASCAMCLVHYLRN